MFRPLVYLTFYFTFLINNDNVFWLMLLTLTANNVTHLITSKLF